MANRGLFAPAIARLLPRAAARNREGAPAYDYAPEAKLAQLAATGTLADNFYASADEQLGEVLAAARAVDPGFVARAAIYARRAGAMKDMPALLAAYLTVADPDLSAIVFDRVVDNARMLRSFVQIMRSGQVGRASLGSRPKRLVQGWLARASMRELMAAATGTAPSLADVIRMVHPRPADDARRAFYGWLLGRPHDAAALPAEIAAFEAWKRDPALPLPLVPFAWLTHHPLDTAQWAALARTMGWQALRMNLNTLARRGAFALDGVAEAVAVRIADRETLRRVRPQPYQLMIALGRIDDGVPTVVRDALETALEQAIDSVPRLPGRIVVCPDVSASMACPATGYRKGASSKLRCVDVAALVAAAILRANRRARVLPFEWSVAPIALDPFAPLSVNTARLAAIGGGGTAVSAPLAQLNAEGAAVDLVVIVSDNQSWCDATRGGATATMQEWYALKRRNPGARLVCIDIAPHGTTQASGRGDILNVGGFSDAVFDHVARFASGRAPDWVAEIGRIAL